MLASYRTTTLALLQAPSSPVPLIPQDRLDSYINTSRLQVAAQGGCVRDYPTLPLAPGTARYNFSAITGLKAGVGGVYHIRQLWYQLPGTDPVGQVWVTPRPFEYFGVFMLNNPAPIAGGGAPTTWAQFGQGEEGNIFIDPAPDLPYDCSLDVLGVPIALVDDSTPEAIPDIWTLAVPFYAAWLGYQSLQRQPYADRMMERFKEQMGMARAAANPDLQSENWSQQPQPMVPNQLGLAAAARGQ